MAPNGFAELDGEIQRILDAAREKGASREQDDRRAFDAGLSRMERTRRLAVLDSWGVPKRTLRSLHPKRLTQTKPLMVVQDWVSQRDKKGWALVLSSAPGTGKSVAAAWWLLQESEGRRPSSTPVRRWCRIGYLLRQSAYDGALEALAAPGPLVIDDLGTEYGDRGRYFLSRLDEFLDERYSQMRPTIITTNLKAEVFAERYGERIADRLEEEGRFEEFVLPSMRVCA